MSTLRPVSQGPFDRSSLERCRLFCRGLYKVNMSSVQMMGTISSRSCPYMLENGMQRLTLPRMGTARICVHLLRERMCSSCTFCIPLLLGNGASQPTCHLSARKTTPRQQLRLDVSVNTVLLESFSTMNTTKKNICYMCFLRSSNVDVSKTYTWCGERAWRSCPCHLSDDVTVPVTKLYARFQR